VAEDINALNPAFYRVVGDPDADVHGFVVIDSFVSGRGTGGVRCTESVTLDEVARLAREMTYKFAFLHLPSGGAKAGLVAPPGLTPEERLNLFHEFGKAIGDLIRDGKYVGGLDMGTSVSDIETIMSGAGAPIHAESSNPEIDSNYFTALTVFVTARALLEARGRQLEDTSILLEGLGKVGSHLLRLLGDAGARIVGISTLCGAIYNEDGLDTDEILLASAKSGDAFVTEFPGCEHLAATDLFLKPADLLIPGGGADSLNEQNVDHIKASWIVPIANICATADIEARLHRRGIEFIPGFVSNSGGVFCWYLGRLSEETRETIIRDRFKARITRLVRAADESGQSIPDAAREISHRNLAAMQRLDNGDTTARLISLAYKMSPMRLGYVIGAKIFGGRWGRTPNILVRSYYDARYFR
jgi:glutamate dehydrogenase/leucine dehydrogenase